MSIVLELNSVDPLNLENSSATHVVEFYRPHCWACKSFAPVYEELARENPEINFYKMNVETNNENEENLARKWKVFGVPTIRIFGHEITPEKSLQEILGRKSKETIQTLLNQHKKAKAPETHSTS